MSVDCSVRVKLNSVVNCGWNAINIQRDTDSVSLINRTICEMLSDDNLKYKNRPHRVIFNIEAGNFRKKSFVQHKNLRQAQDAGQYVIRDIA